MTTYHFVAASEPFLTEEEPLEEVLRERVRHYGEQGRTIDFWLVRRPAFLEAPELAPLAATVPRPAAAVVSITIGLRGLLLPATLGVVGSLHPTTMSEWGQQQVCCAASKAEQPGYASSHKLLA